MQEANESPNEHGKKFIQKVEVVEAVWGKLVLPSHNNDNANDEESAHNQCLTSLFLGETDEAQYKITVNELNNIYILGVMCSCHGVNQLQTTRWIPSETG